MEAIYLVCGAGGPQLKRNPLGATHDGHQFRRTGTPMRPPFYFLVLLLPGCSVTRPIAPVPAPEAVENYLRAHPNAALRVVDSTGRARWVYDASLNADTLRGLRAPTMPRQPVAISLGETREVAAPRFSAVRTLGLVGGILAVVAGLALMAPDPVY